jgi:hypothetical protein
MTPMRTHGKSHPKRNESVITKRSARNGTTATATTIAIANEGVVGLAAKVAARNVAAIGNIVVVGGNEAPVVAQVQKAMMKKVIIIIIIIIAVSDIMTRVDDVRIVGIAIDKRISPLRVTRTMGMITAEAVL